MKSKRLILPTPEYHNRIWRIEFRKTRGHWGYCDREARVICVDPEAPLPMQAAILIHEADHMLHIDDETRAEAAERSHMMLLNMLGLFKEDEE